MTASARATRGDLHPGRAESGYAGSLLGPLDDADLTKEQAQLTALQTRQALGDESPLGMNPAPQTLLSLFSPA